MVTAEWALSVLISIHKPFAEFCLPCLAEEGSDRAALIGTWYPDRVSPPHLQSRESPATGQEQMQVWKGVKQPYGGLLPGGNQQVCGADD